MGDKIGQKHSVTKTTPRNALHPLLCRTLTLERHVKQPEQDHQADQRPKQQGQKGGTEHDEPIAHEESDDDADDECSDGDGARATASQQECQHDDAQHQHEQRSSVFAGHDSVNGVLVAGTQLAQHVAVQQEQECSREVDRVGADRAGGTANA